MTFQRKQHEHEQLDLNHLYVGCEIEFGDMQQPNLSGHYFPVTEVNSYLFDKDSFVAYRLKDDASTLNLIVAEGDDHRTAFLALSLQLPEEYATNTTSKNAPSSWFALEHGEQVQITKPLSVDSTWFAREYRQVMSGSGRFLPGDFRLRRSMERVTLSETFDYVMLLNDDHAHALEVERYEDGRMIVYATCYCPATDIVEVSHTPRSRILPFVDKHVEAQLPALDAGTLDMPLHSKLGVLQPVVDAPVDRDERLACSTKLAARLIDEAERNQMMISELIRKVVDLPASVNEEVWIPCALHNDEYAELARRYDMDPSDHASVRERMIEELEQFVGLKKKK